MISFFQAIILGLTQGITELFPISSLGHSVLMPALFGWNINENSGIFLIFLVAVHCATALVLFIFFFKDWVLIIEGFFRSVKNRMIHKDDTYEKLAWLIVIATIPAGILGLLFQKKIQSLLGSVELAAIFLMINGFLLFAAEFLRKRKEISLHSDADTNIAKISWLQSVKIGIAQCLALIPGFSRTGSTLGAGLFSGLDHESAARFSFLLATPIIFAASILKLPELFHVNKNASLPILTGALFAALGAYISVKFLTKYFKTKTLNPFAVYCICAGAISFLILFLR